MVTRTCKTLVMLHFALMLAACEKPAEPSAAIERRSAASNVQAAEAEVRAFIERYNGHYAANDLDRYFASFDPGLTQWWPTGRVDLKTYNKDWRQTIAAGGGIAKVTVSDLRIQVDPTGDAAVASYLLEVIPREKARAQTIVERNQETDVLFKRNGKWKVVHLHYTPAGFSPTGPQ